MLRLSKRELEAERRAMGADAPNFPTFELTDEAFRTRDVILAQATTAKPTKRKAPRDDFLAEARRIAPEHGDSISAAIRHLAAKFPQWHSEWVNGERDKAQRRPRRGAVHRKQKR